MSLANRISAEDDEPIASATPTPQMSYAGIMPAIWRRRWWVLLFTIVGSATTAIYLSKQVPIYRSSSRVYIQQNAPKIMGDAGLAVSSPVATQCELLRATPMMTLVADMTEVKSLPMMRETNNSVGTIKAGLVVAGEGDFVNIAFESPYPKDAAVVVNSVVDQYLTSIKKQRKNTAAEALKLLESEKDKRDLELQQKLQDTLNFKRSHGMLSFQDERGNIILERLGKLSDALTTAQLETVDAQADFETVDVLKDHPDQLLQLARGDQPVSPQTSINLGQASDHSENQADRLEAAMEPMRQELEKAERDLAKIKRRQTDDHPDVEDAKIDIELLKEQIADREKSVADKETQIEHRETDSADAHRTEIEKRQVDQDKNLVVAYVSKAQRRLAAAKQREAQLLKSFDEQKQLAFDLNATSAEYTSMDNELKRLETFSDMLANRIKEINISEDTGLVNANVIEVAVPGKSPVRPERVKTMSTGTALSFLLGVGFALLLDFMDQRIRSGEEVAALLQTTVLGVIPHISAREATDVRGRKVMLDPNSNIAESYRTLRTAMHFGSRKIKKILVTSPAPGDGKSTSISNLAIAMAQSGRKVLLIDADCRRPTQHKVFNLSDEKGLASVLLGVDALDGAIQWTTIPNLDLLPCGPIPPNPSEILDSQAFLDLMKELEGRYDHILIDSPPLIPVTDARILAALCDVTLLVLRAEKTTRRIAQYAKESLDSVGAKLAGAVVNDVTRRSQGYGYYYGYGYGYGYTYGGYGNGKKDKVKENGKTHTAA